MIWPLLLAALAMGLAAAPHCALMCGAACTALTQRSALDSVVFHGGRVLGYSVAGAVAASSSAALGGWLQAAPALRPLWTLLHLGFLGLGLWWLATGRHPRWMSRRDAVHITTSSLQFQRPGARLQVLRAGGSGMAWVAWPCAALQAALLLAVLAPNALGGGLVMAAFALASLPGLLVAPWAWGWIRQKWQPPRAGRQSAVDWQGLGLRAGGLALMTTSTWVLTQGLWHRVVAWCLS